MPSLVLPVQFRKSRISWIHFTPPTLQIQPGGQVLTGYNLDQTILQSFAESQKIVLKFLQAWKRKVGIGSSAAPKRLLDHGWQH